jgi:hypothetical protein
MMITLEPTEEMYSAPIDGVEVKVRIWRGRSANGVAIEAYVLAITPVDPSDQALLQSQLPPFMRPARQVYQIADFPKEEASADDEFRRLVMAKIKIPKEEASD